MTFEEFLAACSSAQVVATADGPALLIGTTVIQFKGDSWAEYFAKALRMIPPLAPEIPTEPVAPIEPPLTNSELISQIDNMFREMMAEIGQARDA
jgi:hypothetical protein